MKLSDICDVYSGYAFKTFNDLGHGVPVIKISNLLPDGSIDLINCLFTTENIKEKFYSKKSDIYIALSGATTGKISIMDKDNTFAINQRVGIVRNRSTISNEYLKYFLMSRSNRILEEASGCAQPNISPKQIANYDVPIYSDAVMNKIVSELREIDKIKNTYQKQLELLDELVKARFVEMFGDPIENQKDWEV
ncbi:restriction endonuclease subunit S, partial [Catenibacterium sp.]|uniref:restriction endonuclease subunit S n=1 Tax=Catenibacterium sp. TaxID=2049022 RepID=UPI003FD7C74E